MSDKLCKHITSITDLKTPQAHVCEECIKSGDRWVHLRTCQTCGVTLCCDSSPQTHMSKHNHQTSHPVVISAEPGEQWFWCYPHEKFVKY